MSDEYSLASNFQAGKISGPEYDRRMERLRNVEDDDDALTALKVAAQGALFTLHCSLLGYTHREDAEGIEMTSEAMANLRAALVKAYAPEQPPPICSGCSPIEPFEPVAERPSRG